MAQEISLLMRLACSFKVALVRDLSERKQSQATLERQGIPDGVVRVLESHGRVVVKSELGVGTTFRILFAAATTRE